MPLVFNREDYVERHERRHQEYRKKVSGEENHKTDGKQWRDGRPGCFFLDRCYARPAVHWLSRQSENLFPGRFVIDRDPIFTFAGVVQGKNLILVNCQLFNLASSDFSIELNQVEIAATRFRATL